MLKSLKDCKVYGILRSIQARSILLIMEPAAEQCKLEKQAIISSCIDCDTATVVASSHGTGYGSTYSRLLGIVSGKFKCA